MTTIQNSADKEPIDKILKNNTAAKSIKIHCIKQADYKYWGKL